MSQETKTVVTPLQVEVPVPVPDIDPRIVKIALKQALKEWLDEQFAIFGKWALRSVMAAAFSSFVWFIIEFKPWK